MTFTIRQRRIHVCRGDKPCGRASLDVRWVLLCGLFASPVGAQSGDKPTGDKSATVKSTARPSATQAKRSPEIDEKNRDNERARVLYRLGSNAYKAGRVDESRQLLSEAWELCKSYDVAATLGQVEFDLGHYVEANQLLDYCIANFPPIESDERLAKMKVVREQARSKVAELVVETDCASPSLTLDAERSAELSANRPIYVLPGSHDLRLRCGEETNSKAFAVAEGARLTVRLDVHREVAPRLGPEKRPAAKAKATPGAETPQSGPPRWPIFVGGGLVAGQIAAAIGLSVASSRAGRRADGYLDELGGAPSACVNQADAAIATTCGRLGSARADEHSYGNASMLTLGTAAATAIVTVTYWLWADPFSSRAKSGVTSRLEGSPRATAFTLMPWTPRSPSERSIGLSVANAF